MSQSLFPDLMPPVALPIKARGWAEFSKPIPSYRYLLGREWDRTLPRILVSGINPSKAGATENDMTVTKLIGFGQRWGAGSFELINPFSLVATDIGELIAAATAGKDVVGPENDEHIVAAVSRASRVVIAWGGDAKHRALKERVLEVLGKLSRLPVFCLEPTKDGFPRHPSRASYSTPLVPYESAIK